MWGARRGTVFSRFSVRGPGSPVCETLGLRLQDGCSGRLGAPAPLVSFPPGHCQPRPPPAPARRLSDFTGALAFSLVLEGACKELGQGKES